MAVATLAVIAGAEHSKGTELARTMGLTTFAISNVLFSLCTRDERRSVFSLDVLEDRMMVLCSAGSLVAILFGAEVGILNRILGTVDLNLHQWLICLVVGLAIIPVSEARRLLLRRRSSSEPPPDDAASPAGP